MHLHYNMGHMGIEKTLSRAKEGLWWPRYVNVIQERLLICYGLCKDKSTTPRAYVEQQSILLGGPMERWH